MDRIDSVIVKKLETPQEAKKFADILVKKVIATNGEKGKYVLDLLCGLAERLNIRLHPERYRHDNASMCIREGFYSSGGYEKEEDYWFVPANKSVGIGVEHSLMHGDDDRKPESKKTNSLLSRTIWSKHYGRYSGTDYKTAFVDDADFQKKIFMLANKGKLLPYVSKVFELCIEKRADYMKSNNLFDAEKYAPLMQKYGVEAEKCNDVFAWAAKYIPVLLVIYRGIRVGKSGWEGGVEEISKTANGDIWVHMYSTNDGTDGSADGCSLKKFLEQSTYKEHPYEDLYVNLSVDDKETILEYCYNKIRSGIESGKLQK